MNSASLVGNLYYGYVHIPCIILLAVVVASVLAGTVSGIPPFEGRTDIGKVRIPGSVLFDSTNRTIRMTGSGENIWGNQDAFYFVWNKVEGDVACMTAIAWEGKGKHPHRKAGWMIRAGLEPGQRCFQVRTETGKKCRLCYNESHNLWSLTRVLGGRDVEGNPQDSGK